jgi:hypothetical protein
MAIYDQMRQDISPKEFSDEMLAGGSQVDPQAVAEFRAELDELEILGVSGGDGADVRGRLGLHLAHLLGVALLDLFEAGGDVGEPGLGHLAALVDLDESLVGHHATGARLVLVPAVVVGLEPPQQLVDRLTQTRHVSMFVGHHSSSSGGFSTTIGRAATSARAARTSSRYRMP